MRIKFIEDYEKFREQRVPNIRVYDSGWSYCQNFSCIECCLKSSCGTTPGTNEEMNYLKSKYPEDFI